jgi:hypothetical protein
LVASWSFTLSKHHCATNSSARHSTLIILGKAALEQFAGDFGDLRNQAMLANCAIHANKEQTRFDLFSRDLPSYLHSKRIGTAHSRESAFAIHPAGL